MCLRKTLCNLKSSLRFEGKTLIAFYAFLTLTFHWTFGFVNIYMQSDEALKLLGLKAELSYVRNGSLNDYALGFEVLVPDHISELYFTWQNLKSTPIPYTIDITVSNPEELKLPQLNISRKGNVPHKEEVFRIVLQCMRRVNAEIIVFLNINVTIFPPNVTSLVLKRKKICLKDKASSGPQMLDKSSIGTLMHDESNGGTLMLADAIMTSKDTFYIGIASAGAVVLLITVVALTTYYLRSRKSRRTEDTYAVPSPALSTTTQGHTYPRLNTPNSASVANSYASYKRITPVATAVSEVMGSDISASVQLPEINVDRGKVILLETIQEGTFGQIFHATVTNEIMGTTGNIHVFVKTVTDQASQMQVSVMMAEGMMMLGIAHKSILPLIGICYNENFYPLSPMLLYPYMNQGNLKKYLHKCKVASEGHCHTLQTRDLVSMAIQILQGMAFLHKRKIVHRDIATRNCVVDDWLQVKITDNALSRDFFPNDYHCLGDNENRPIKWLSIESLLQKEFSSASDVWTFGVTLWELMTLAQQPYVEIDPFEMDAYLRDGYRLAQPINCPDELYVAMACCWVAVPEKRPTDAELLTCLQELFTALGQFI